MTRDAILREQIFHDRLVAAAGEAGTIPATLLAIRMNRASEVTRLRGDLPAERVLRDSFERAMRTAFGACATIGQLDARTYAVLLDGAVPGAAEIEGELRRIRDHFNHHPVRVRSTYYYPRTKAVMVPPGCPVADAQSLLLFALERVADYEEHRSLVHIDAGDPAYREHKRLRRGLRHVRDALYRRRLGLHLQPIVPLRPGLAGRGELLLRVFDEDYEPRPPGPFLRVAEYNRVLRELDRHVIELVFGHRDRLLAAIPPGGAVSFNLSGPSFSDEALVEELIACLAARPELRGRLVVEVTETVANRDFGRTVETLQGLRGGGYRVALDDIGVGSSNLANLVRFPVDAFKIDGQFVTALLEDEYARSVVCFVRDAARRLGVQTIAEFVEDRETLEALRALGIDYAQGFHTGRPAPCIPPGCVRDPAMLGRPLESSRSVRAP